MRHSLHGVHRCPITNCIVVAIVRDSFAAAALWCGLGCLTKNHDCHDRIDSFHSNARACTCTAFVGAYNGSNCYGIHIRLSLCSEPGSSSAELIRQSASAKSVLLCQRLAPSNRSGADQRLPHRFADTLAASHTYQCYLCQMQTLTPSR